MASCLIHLSAAKRIMDLVPIEDPERFRLGEILPDTSAEGGKYAKITHFKKVDSSTGIRIFDLLSFRDQFGDRLSDSLYLGYYCHLIQDAVFRWFVFDYKRLQDRVEAWDSDTLQKLYHDYSLQNHPLIDAYGIRIPQNLDLSQEAISQVAPLEVEEYLQGIRVYYDTPAPEPPEPYIYSWEDTEEYLDMACKACLKEIERIRGEGPVLTGHEWEYRHE